MAFAKVHGCPQWELRAEALSGGPCWSLCQSGDCDTPVMLARLVYETGFEVMHPTAASAIMERLYRHGKAELVR